MKTKILKTFRSDFFKNIATLASGTIISQVVVIASSPLLSRIYFVDSFGKLAIFTSITAFFSVVSTGRFELALGLPKRDEDALRIFKLIISIGLLISLFFLILNFFLRDVLVVKDRVGFLVQKESYISPLYIFFIAIHSALTYWNQRKKQYKTITIANAVQIISATFFSLILGYLFGIQSGMIYALVLGIFCSCLYYFLIEKKLLLNVLKQNDIKVIGKEYISFPKYSTFSDLSLVASQQFIPIIFSVLYSTTVVGFFSMANRIVRLPNIVITSAIGNVFRNDAIDAIHEKGNCETLYRSTFIKLVLLSLPVYIVLFLFAPFLFSFIFGKFWVEAGEYARIISVFLFFEFVTTPLNTLFNIRSKQRLLMNYQMTSAFFGFIAIYIGFYFFSSPYVSLVFYSINSIVFSLIQIFNSHKIAKAILH